MTIELISTIIFLAIILEIAIFLGVTEIRNIKECTKLDKEMYEANKAYEECISHAPKYIEHVQKKIPFVEYPENCSYELKIEIDKINDEIDKLCRDNNIAK